jgi:hypothetical protein
MASGAGTTTATGTGSPCGACKFLRRKCATDCIFAPYFCTEQGPARFAAIHKVFGASNVSKLLLHVPVHDRCEAVVTIAYEAQARIRDPVYGCVAHIFALQQQVIIIQYFSKIFVFSFFFLRAIHYMHIFNFFFSAKSYMPICLIWVGRSCKI